MISGKPTPTWEPGGCHVPLPSPRVPSPPPTPSGWSFLVILSLFAIEPGFEPCTTSCEEDPAPWQHAPCTYLHSAASYGLARTRCEPGIPATTRATNRHRHPQGHLALATAHVKRQSVLQILQIPEITNATPVNVEVQERGGRGAAAAASGNRNSTSYRIQGQLGVS